MIQSVRRDFARGGLGAGGRADRDDDSDGGRGVVSLTKAPWLTFDEGLCVTLPANYSTQPTR